MKRHLNLNLTSVIILIAAGVLLPVMLLTAAGIVALVIADDAGGIVTGVLVISFAVTALGSGLVTVVLASKKARLARLQSDFLANVSHEFRTPLSAIRLYAQTLQSGKLTQDPQQTAQCLATILRETEWLDVMIDRVLTWRASSRDMLTLNLESQSVTQAVNDALEKFKIMTIPGELEITSSLDTRLPVKHDRRALSAVLLNLLTNAYKYTGKKKRIKVDVRDEDGEVAISVNDNGIGLTPAELKRVFEPFYRVERQDGSHTGGTGLGLAIAWHLVHQQGGAITVQSQPGQGSTFTIRLPAATAAGKP